MLTLPLEYRKNGFDYKMFFRDNEVAIYEQWDEGKIIAFEVCEIVYMPKGEVFGKVVDEREKIPSTEQWGTKAFTVKTLEQAMIKKDEMKHQIMLRKQKVQASVATGVDSSNQS